GEDVRRSGQIDTPLRRTGMKGTLGDLRATAASPVVRAARLILVSTFYRFDNRYICDCAKVSSDWAAGVCTLDPDDPHSPELLSHYRREYGIKGMRSIPGRSGRIDDQGVRDLWNKDADEDLAENAPIEPETEE